MNRWFSCKKQTVDKSQILVWASLAFAAGVLTGVVLAPVKGGFGNNTTYATHHHYDQDGPEPVNPLSD